MFNPSKIDNQNSNNLSNVDKCQKSEDSINKEKSKIPLDNYSESNIKNNDYKELLQCNNNLNECNGSNPQRSNCNRNNNKIISNMLHNNNLNIKSIAYYFSFPPKIGLINVGASGYMNTILQCLCNILHFVDFFKFDSKVGEIINKYEREGKLCLTSSFKILIDNLWPNEKKSQIIVVVKIIIIDILFPRNLKTKYQKWMIYLKVWLQMILKIC